MSEQTFYAPIVCYMIGLGRLKKCSKRKKIKIVGRYMVQVLFFFFFLFPFAFTAYYLRAIWQSLSFFFRWEILFPVLFNVIIKKKENKTLIFASAVYNNYRFVLKFWGFRPLMIKTSCLKRKTEPSKFMGHFFPALCCF